MKRKHIKPSIGCPPNKDREAVIQAIGVVVAIIAVVTLLVWLS